MILTGLAQLDDALGGLQQGRIHLLTGGPGSGKTALALRFLWTGLERGETGLLVTLGNSRDLKSLAKHLGVDVDRHVRASRLLLLRYRDEFTNRLAYSGQPSLVIKHLDQLIDGLEPKRIVIDTASPFLADGTASGEGMLALAQWLERTGATSLVTYGEDISGGYDRRIEPVVQRAAAIVRLERAHRGRITADVVTARYPVHELHASLSLADVATNGLLVSATDAPDVRPAVRDVLYAYTTPAHSSELLGLVRGSRLVGNVTTRRAASAAHPPSVRDVGGAVVETDRRSFSLALQLVSAIAQREPAGAIVVVSRAPLRSVDRARLIESGADDVLAGDMSAVEVLARLETALQRGHYERPLMRPRNASLPLQRAITKGTLRALHATELAQALTAAESEATPVGGTLLRVRPPHEDEVSRDQLLAVVLRTARVESGDLVAVVGRTIVVHLRGTRRDDADAFLERVRARWSVVGNGTIRGEPLSGVDDATSMSPTPVVPAVSIVQ